jgi:hypothetical protein
MKKARRNTKEKVNALVTASLRFKLRNPEMIDDRIKRKANIGGHFWPDGKPKDIFLFIMRKKVHPITIAV